MVPVFTIQLPRDVQARDHQRRLADNMYRLPVNTRMTYRKLEMRGYSRFEQQYRTVIVNKKNNVSNNEGNAAFYLYSTTDT